MYYIWQESSSEAKAAVMAQHWIQCIRAAWRWRDVSGKRAFHREGSHEKATLALIRRYLKVGWAEAGEVGGMWC